MFRNKVNMLEGQVDGLKETCKVLIKASKKYREGLQSMHTAETEFAGALSMCMEADEDLQSMAPFVGVLHQLASYHQTLFTQMEELLSGPLQRWQATLGDVKDLRKRLDKCGLEYDEQRTRYLGMRKKTKQEVLDKQAAELGTARREFDEARFCAARKLVVVDCRKRYEFLDALGSSMEAHMHFFRRGNDLFHGLEPKIHDLLQLVEGHRSQEKQEAARLDEMVEAQREAQAYTAAASAADQSSNTAAGPLQLTGDAARRASNIESMIKASLDTDGSNFSTIKQGYLFKRSSNMRGDWKRRFFILDSRGALCYYRNKDANSATHTVNLLFSTIKPDAEDPSLRCCFRVVSPNKTYTLQAENDAEVGSWIEALQAVIAFLINNTTPEQLQALLPEPSDSGPGTPTAGPSSAAKGHRRVPSNDSDLSVQSDGEFAMIVPRERLHGSGSHLPGIDSPGLEGSDRAVGCFGMKRGVVQSAEKSTPQYMNLNRRRTGGEDDGSPYEIVRQVPGNRMCADCGTADPDWASLNYGITLCIACSGVHRQMGVHVSKVRSLTLDVKVWEQSVLEMFQGLGNRFMNSLLEDNLQQNIAQAEDSWLWSADSDGEEEVVDAPTLEQRASLASVPSGGTQERKPRPSDALAVKEKYIQLKYASRTFLVSSSLSRSQVQEELWTAVEGVRLQDTMRCILLAGDVNKRYSHPGALALFSSALEQAEGLRLASPGLSASSSGTVELSLLHLAAKAGHQGMMELLLQYGAKPDVEDLYRRTPLHYCMLFNTTQTAKLLLRKGADAGRKDAGNCTALDAAMMRGRVTDEELFVLLTDTS